MAANTAALPKHWYKQCPNVPTFLNEVTAKDHLDRSKRIFIADGNAWSFSPESEFDPWYLARSFHLDDWYTKIVPSISQKEADKMRLFKQWALIMNTCRFDHRKLKHRRKTIGSLCFVLFEKPEVQRIYAKSPKPKHPYELRWSDQGQFYYVNYFEPAPAGGLLTS